jgi:hypothetical protein
MGKPVLKSLLVLLVFVVLLVSGCTSFTGQATTGNCREVREQYTEQVPVQVIRDESVVLLDNEVNRVLSGRYIYYSINIDISEKTNNKILLTFAETGNSDIKFIVLDENNFVKWSGNQSVNQTYQTEVESGIRRSGTFSFTPRTTGGYSFIFDNRYSALNKTARLSGWWTYTHQVTEYTNETTYRNITKCD